jgi:hypothetical protein
MGNYKNSFFGRTAKSFVFIFTFKATRCHNYTVFLMELVQKILKDLGGTKIAK